MVIIAKHTVERLMKYFGAERVSSDAEDEMIKILEEITKNITQKAAIYAKHAKRKTIKKDDIILAYKNLNLST